MSRWWKYLVAPVILTASLNVQTLAAEPEFSVIEQVKVGKSDGAVAVASLSGGAAIVLTTPLVGGGIRGFALSKVVDGGSTPLAYFNAEPLSGASKKYVIKGAILQVDEDDNIIVLYNVMLTDGASGTGAELRVAVFKPNGDLKYAKVLDRNDKAFYIDRMSAGLLPNGNILVVYDRVISGSTDIFMTEFAPGGHVVASRQVSNKADNVDGRYTAESLGPGHALAIGRSGQFRIIWSYFRSNDRGVRFSSTVIATYRKFDERESLTLLDEKRNSDIASLGTFFRPGGEFLDVIISGRISKFKLYRELSSGRRKLVNERRLSFKEGAWRSLLLYKGKYIIYANRRSTTSCYLTYANIADGEAIGTVRLNNEVTTQNCESSSSVIMADGSVGSVFSSRTDRAVEVYFVRHKDR